MSASFAATMRSAATTKTGSTPSPTYERRSRRSCFEADDRVAVAVRNSGRGRASGAAAEGRYYVTCVVRAGRIVAGREYATREQALEGIRLLTYYDSEGNQR
jgi:ketosteroid isomerase-like protein